MKISFTPQLRADRLSVRVEGDTLTVNGEDFDFSSLEEGATLPAAAVECDFLASDVIREAGQITLTLILPHGSDAPEIVRFPQPVHVTGDGPVPLPGSEEQP
nr:hypothetical protein [Paracoccus saliphilus]